LTGISAAGYNGRDPCVRPVQKIRVNGMRALRFVAGFVDPGSSL
jgi:hypothetical protein